MCRFDFSPLSLLNNNRQTLRTLLRRIGDIEIRGDELEHSVESLAEEAFVEVFGSAGEEEVQLNAMSFGKPFGSLLCLEGEVMVAGADLDLEAFYLNILGMSLGLLLLFVLVILILAVISDLGDRGDGLG